VFTVLLLADMVRQNEVALAEPVSKYLPVGVKVPERNGRSITLVDLATHTSGLPFMPENAPDFNGPAARKYSAADLVHYVAGYKLTRDIGSKWDYSNIGYWLLSEALASRAGVDYESLLHPRVIAPLKSANTDFAFVVEDEGQSRRRPRCRLAAIARCVHAANLFAHAVGRRPLFNGQRSLDVSLRGHGL
jgi:serine-type D-Ala-D-Ala carboxypeptidase/endopeptidase